jgi:hypothetical protein
VGLVDKILGRPLKSSERKKEELTVVTGVPVLGLDALASTAYGPEAALTILVSLGVAGLHYMPMITLGILALLVTLYFSYRQTAAAYCLPKMDSCRHSLPNVGGVWCFPAELSHWPSWPDCC